MLQCYCAMNKHAEASPSTKTFPVKNKNPNSAFVFDHGMLSKQTYDVLMAA